jgi:GH24 family phage-related lysozyme (muramidase)
MSCFSHVFGCSTTSTLLSIWRRRLKQADSSQARHKIQVWDQFSFSFYVRFCALYSGFVF